MKDGRECSNEKRILLAAGMSFQKVFNSWGISWPSTKLASRRLPTAAGAKTISAPANYMRRIALGELATASTRIIGFRIG
jgi:hypothetical protein